MEEQLLPSFLKLYAQTFIILNYIILCDLVQK